MYCFVILLLFNEMQMMCGVFLQSRTLEEAAHRKLESWKDFKLNSQEEDLLSVR